MKCGKEKEYGNMEEEGGAWTEEKGQTWFIKRSLELQSVNQKDKMMDAEPHWSTYHSKIKPAFAPEE